MNRRMKRIRMIGLAIMLMTLIFSYRENPMAVDAATVTLAAPTSVKAVSSSYNSITVSWNGVTGASGYRVYKATSSTGKYTYLATTTAKSYNNTGMKTGTAYYYKVRAYKTVGSSKIYGKYSSVVHAIPVPSAPVSINAAASSYSSITASWSGVAGASGYRVYRATSSSGSYTFISDTASISNNNTGLDTGTTYYYKVRAYKIVGSSKVYGKYSSVVYAKTTLSVPASINAAATSYNSITVSWSDVIGADGYRIYRSASSTGTYTYIAATSDKNYIDTGLDTGTTYYYKVRAYIIVGSSKVYGNYTSVVNAQCVMSKPTSFQITAITYDNISFQWNATEGANGYQIYKADSDTGTYALLATTAKTSYINKELTPETTYLYKVRAYRIVGDSRVYSKFTSAISGTTPEAHAEAVSLNKSEDNLSLGNSDTLIASVIPECAVDLSVTWKSSDDTVAIVDNTGTVTPISAGIAIITAATVDGGLTASCTITVNSTGIRGLDVSKWQGTIDWASVKNTGIQFAMIRSSYGSSSVDPKFQTNYQAAKANGLSVGVYHYSYANSVTKAVTEVKFLISVLKGKQFEYPICVDVEDASQSTLDSKTLTDIVMTYTTYLSKAGYYPMVYASKTWFTKKLDDTRLTGTDHWLAQWGTSYTYTGALGIWQYSSTGAIDGIAGNVDLDTSFVDYRSRIKYLKLNGFQ